MYITLLLCDSTRQMHHHLPHQSEYSVTFNTTALLLSGMILDYCTVFCHPDILRVWWFWGNLYLWLSYCHHPSSLPILFLLIFSSKCVNTVIVIVQLSVSCWPLCFNCLIYVPQPESTSEVNWDKAGQLNSMYITVKCNMYNPCRKICKVQECDLSGTFKKHKMSPFIFLKVEHSSRSSLKWKVSSFKTM